MDAAARAGIARRLASAAYESLMIAAVLVVAGFAFLVVSPDPADSQWRPVFQVYLVGVLGLYFTWFWTHGGQTVPMKAWGIRVVKADGTPVTWGKAWIRFIMAWPAVLLCGAGWLWAVVDRDRQFLHDRVAGTRIVRVHHQNPGRS